MVSVMQDDNQLVYGNASQRRSALDRMKGLGVEAARVTMLWRQIAPDPEARRKPRGFNGANPRDYPRQNWDRFDELARDAAARGIQVYFNPTGAGPRWANKRTRVQYAKPTYKPNAKLFQQFVRAAGRRYSGSYRDENQRSSGAAARDVVGNLERAEPARLADAAEREEARRRDDRDGASHLPGAHDRGREGAALLGPRRRPGPDRRTGTDREREEAGRRGALAEAGALPARDVLRQPPLPAVRRAASQGARLRQGRPAARAGAVPATRIRPPPIHEEGAPRESASAASTCSPSGTRAPSPGRSTRSPARTGPAAATAAGVLHRVRVPDAAAGSVQGRLPRGAGGVHQRGGLHRLAPPADLLDRPVPALRRAPAHRVPARHRALLGHLPVGPLHGASGRPAEAGRERVQVPARGPAQGRQRRGSGGRPASPRTARPTRSPSSSARRDRRRG